MMEEQDKIITLLKKLDINYQLIQHPAVYTADEADKYVQAYNFARAKNLFLRNSRGFFLVMVGDQQHLDMYQLKQQLATTRLSFAKPAELEQELGIYPGAVSPFNLINDHQHRVTLVISPQLLAENSLVGCHPNDNTATVVLKFTDLLALIQRWGNPVRILDLGPLA